MSNPNDMIKYFVVTYTNWTHLYFIQTLTADDIEFTQRTLNNEEVYSKFWSVIYISLQKNRTLLGRDVNIFTLACFKIFFIM